MCTTDMRRRPNRIVLLSALAVVAGVGVTPAVAAGPRCRTQPQTVETLRVEAVPGAALRGHALVVEVRVSREGTSTPVEGADISSRLRTQDGPLFAGATTDKRGLATVRLGLDAGLRPGAAVLATEAWSEGTPGQWCVPEVDEHGYVESPVEIR